MFDFDKVWTLLDIILKVAQTGSTELHNIVTAATDELKTIHNDLGVAKAAAEAEAKAKAEADALANAPKAIPSSPANTGQAPTSPVGSLFNKEPSTNG